MTTCSQTQQILPLMTRCTLFNPLRVPSAAFNTHQLYDTPTPAIDFSILHKEQLTLRFEPKKLGCFVIALMFVFPLTLCFYLPAYRSYMESQVL